MKNKDLEYRFTGKEPMLFCKDFMKLIPALCFDDDYGSRASFNLHIFAFTAINLRKSVSFFNRQQMTNDDLVFLNTSFTNFFRASCLFLTAKPTSWTIGHVVPVHTKQLVDKLGVGLGINTMTTTTTTTFILHLQVTNIKKSKKLKNNIIQIKI